MNTKHVWLFPSATFICLPILLSLIYACGTGAFCPACIRTASLSSAISEILYPMLMPSFCIAQKKNYLRYIFDILRNSEIFTWEKKKKAYFFLGEFQRA